MSSSASASANKSATNDSSSSPQLVNAFANLELEQPVDAGSAEDLTDAFERIADEERSAHEAEFLRGFEAGSLDGNVDGYHVGYHKGAEHGAEIGYYVGVCAVYRRHRNPRCGTRVHDALVRCERALSDVPQTNDQNVDIVERVTKARNAFRLLAAKLQISGRWPGAEVNNF